MLASVGQAMPNMPDMNYPSMGGAIATAVHATGTEFGSMSSYVTGLTLATPSGDLIDCDREKNSEIFQAARASIGALGVVTKMRIQNQAVASAISKIKMVINDATIPIMTIGCANNIPLA